jgi:hypothetical protein
MFLSVKTFRTTSPSPDLVTQRRKSADGIACSFSTLENKRLATLKRHPRLPWPCGSLLRWWDEARWPTVLQMWVFGLHDCSEGCQCVRS